MKFEPQKNQLNIEKFTQLFSSSFSIFKFISFYFYLSFNSMKISVKCINLCIHHVTKINRISQYDTTYCTLINITSFVSKRTKKRTAKKFTLHFVQFEIFKADLYHVKKNTNHRQIFNLVIIEMITVNFHFYLHPKCIPLRCNSPLEDIRKVHQSWTDVGDAKCFLGITE